MSTEKIRGGTKKHSRITEGKARLCIDSSVKKSYEAIKILNNAGFKVSTSLVSGLSQPVLTLGSKTYYGLEEIRRVALGSSDL